MLEELELLDNELEVKQEAYDEAVENLDWAEHELNERSKQKGDVVTELQVHTYQS